MAPFHAWVKRHTGWAADLFIYLAIIGVGWFLIGYYVDFNFLVTGYQDWIYQAFRVKSLQAYGIASWDHVWSNGINHWRAYQYIPHYLISWTTILTGLTITQAMLWWSVVIFIGLRVMLYMILRFLGIRRLFAATAVLLSYTFVQQWIAIKDFSIYLGNIFLIPYLFLWIKTFKDERYLYVLTALTGVLWSVHPVFGYTATGLTFFLLLVNGKLKDLTILLRVTLVFLISSAPFSVPYVLAGYRVINPIYTSPQFLRDTVAGEYMGLSLIFFVMLGFSWLVLLLRPKRAPRWAKIILLYSSLYLGVIYFAQQGNLPTFLNQLQISRAIPLLAIFMSFAFGVFLQVGLEKIRSILVPTVLLVLIAFNLVQGVEMASIYTGQPVMNQENPVASYFADRPVPTGSVYFEDVSEASYFTKPGVRFVTSYNEHLQPHPYSMRFRALMKTDVSYTGITARQISLIEDYSTVLGVEYLFVPRLSPLVAGLTEAQGEEARLFTVVDEVRTRANIYAVLRNRNPIYNAYVLDAREKESVLRFAPLPVPTLQSVSYKPWDDEVSRIAGLIREGRSLQPLPLAFADSDRLILETGEVKDRETPAVLITQSYDRNWRLTGQADYPIEATNLRFIYFELPANRSSQVELKNSWPRWHWPVQMAGVAMLLITGVLLMRRAKSADTPSE